MTKPHRWLALAVVFCTACQPGSDASAQAQDLVARFEQALRSGDRDTLREIVTFESRPAVDAMPLSTLSSKLPLVVLEATSQRGAMYVRVRDPNANDPNTNGRDGVFVVVQENGGLRVDLVASAGLTAREVPLPGPATRTVVRPMSPAEREHAARLAREANQRAAPPKADGSD